MAHRLANATSPYLLQHADNPVDWWPWSPEVFDEARRRDVPIFLSVGYAACHWCHVMARESFTDPVLAAALNAGFVPVKVDREERPDVDAVYMQATQALTGQGGWPMSVFLTPDGQPFYAGTYFPPAPGHGLPSFGQVVEAVAEAWRKRRDEVVDSAGRIAEQLAARREPVAEGAPLDAEGCAAAVAQLGREFDPAHGGFGRAPKFPPSMVLEALLRDGGPEAMAMVERTLDAMARGGIYDQLAGGFARYSVDAGWVVPHFEKMLYDNALLLGCYTHWWRRTGSPLAARVVAETVEWLNAELRTGDGGYAASLDADSDDAAGRHREGAFYVWTPEQLRAACGPDAQWAAGILQVTEAGTFEEGASTLQLPVDPDPERWAAVRGKLRAARAERARPARDDKVVAAWNGWLIASLVQAARVFDRADWLADATAAAAYVWSVHWRDGRLRRTSRDGRAGDAPGILEDYAGLAHGCCELAAALGSAEWLDRARSLLEVVVAEFDDGRGGFFDTASDAEQLYARPQDPTDNATPSGLSATVHALRLLAQLDADERWAVRADHAAGTVAPLARQAPRFAGWLLADALAGTPGRIPAQVVLVGGSSDQRAALARLAARRASAGSVVLAGEPDAPGLPLLAGRVALDGQATGYVCRHFVCRLPVTGADDLLAQLAG